MVDDDPGIQHALEAILEMEGYEVRLAGDGLDALAQIEQAPPEAILLDLMMPRMNGYDMMDEMQRRGLHPTIPVIVLTADGRAEQKAASIAAQGWLAKPFEIDDLIALLERVLNPSEERAAGE